MLSDIVTKTARLPDSFEAVAGIDPDDISKDTYIVNTDTLFAAFRPFHIRDMPIDDLISRPRGFGLLMIKSSGDLKLRDGTYAIDILPEKGIGQIKDAGGKTVGRGTYEAALPIVAPIPTPQTQGIDIEFSGKCSVGVGFPLTLKVSCYGGAQSAGGGIGVTTCNNLTIDLTPFIL